MARKLKIWMLSTMLPSRFNYVVILNFHKANVDSLDLIKVANQFSDPNENKKRIFGKFSEKNILQIVTNYIVVLYHYLIYSKILNGVLLFQII